MVFLCFIVTTKQISVTNKSKIISKESKHPTSHVWWPTPIIQGTQEVEIMKISISILGQPGQKISETPISTNRSDMVVHNYNPSYAGGLSRRVII
jgi:hypothetical protein